jgi:hypothetical protein
MKLLALPLLTVILTGCAVYPDAPQATYPTSTAVYGSYYSGYPHYGYYDRYPYYDHRHGRNWRDHDGRRDNKDDRRDRDDDRKESTRGRSPPFDHDRSVLHGPDWKHGRSSRDSGSVLHGPDWKHGRSSRDSGSRSSGGRDGSRR